MFERLAANGLSPLLLRTQYRCHPTLSGLASRLFYEGKLLDGVTAGMRGPLLRLFPPLCIIDYSGWKGLGKGEALDVYGKALPDSFFPIFGPQVMFDSSSMGEHGEGNGGQSLYNDFEADLICKCICELLIRKVKPNDIGVICLYTAQVKKVREKLYNLSKKAKNEILQIRHHDSEAYEPVQGTLDAVTICLCSADEVTVNTVDAFQGAERKVILVATSRTRPYSSISTSSFSSTMNTQQLDHVNNPRRLCVLLTRARNHLIVITHAASLYANGSNSSWGIVLRTAAGINGAIRTCALKQLLEPCIGK
jgi:superfamily I DNA and/or RNA helicase